MDINRIDGKIIVQEENVTGNKINYQDTSLFQTSLQASIAQKGDAILEVQKKDKTVGSILDRNGLPEGMIRYTMQCASMEKQSISKTEVRNLSYAQADKVKVDILNGYVLKAKLLQDKTLAEEGVLYVEAKYEDGCVEAYTVNTDQIKPDTTNAIESIALEVVKGKEKE